MKNTTSWLNLLLIAMCILAYKIGYIDGIDHENESTNEKYNIKIDKQIDSDLINEFEMRTTINHMLYIDSIKTHDLLQLLNEKTRSK